MANTTFSGPVTSDNGFTSTGIAFANLPTASASTGRIIFCTNALKASETTGNGTGNLVFSDTAGWVVVGNNGATIA